MSLKNLRRVLKDRPNGQIDESLSIDSLLADCWGEFDGSDLGGMAPSKLIARIEDVVWASPILSFSIERHGGAVQGSSRAELQSWSVDVDQKIATFENSRFRQLRPRRPPWDAKTQAAKVAELVKEKKEDQCLKRYSDGRVRVLVGEIVPSDSAPKQTVTGRRKRFRKALDELLAPDWRREQWTYEQVG